MVIKLELIEVLRAKSKDQKRYLLWEHTQDIIYQVKKLHEFIKTNENVIAYKEIKSDFFFEDLIKAAFIHDLGKINPYFQGLVFKYAEKKEKEWLSVKKFFKELTDQKVKDHEILSVIFSLIFLNNDERNQKIRTAILLHHYNDFYVKQEKNIRYIIDNYPEIEKFIEFIIKNNNQIKSLLIALIEKQKELLGEHISNALLNEIEPGFIRLTKLLQKIKRGYGLTTELKLYEIDNEKPDYSFFVFLGCLRRCDYGASGQINVEEISSIETVFQQLEVEISKAIKLITNKEKIWQKEIIAKIDHSKKNIVLVAPTGSGKTEFALLWAKKSGRKVIYTLPLRVALNDLFTRFQEFKIAKNGKKAEINYFDEKYLGILHSTSFMEYLDEEKEGKKIDINCKMLSAKLFSTPVLLTTPDQIFLTSLKYYGFDKVLSLYPTSTVIIDEIQAYNPEMAAIIIKTLEIINKLSGKILIITATFPPYFRKFLFKNKGNTQEINLDFTLIDLKEDISDKKSIKNFSLRRHKIQLIDDLLFNYDSKDNNPSYFVSKDSFRKLNKILTTNPDKNVLIIVNNVGKAISLYETFKNHKIYAELLHSRIIEKEKSKRISKIKNNLKNRKHLILISTQMVEASVDVDFDILITEISPVDSQIQRWGRIYRNRESDYKESTPNVYIYTGIDKGTKAIYQPEIMLNKTIEVLEKYEKKGILNYENEREIIEQVFKAKINGRTLREYYEEKIEETLEWLKYFSAEKKSQAQTVFRRMAGIQVLIPDVMKEFGDDEIEKALGALIADRTNKDNWVLPFESKNESTNSIAKIIKKKTQIETSKWTILKKLYSYSFHVPIYAFGKNFKTYVFLEREMFKGFYVLKQLPHSSLKKIKELGINKLENLNMDKLEIEEENII